GGSPNSVSLADTVPGNGDSLGNLVFATGSNIYLVDDSGSSATIVAQKALDGVISGPTPLVDPRTGNIFIGTTRRIFYALRPDLTNLFAVRLESPIQASASLSQSGDTVYVLTYKGFLHALDAATGAELDGFPLSPVSRQSRYKRADAPVVDIFDTVYVAGD